METHAPPPASNSRATAGWRPWILAALALAAVLLLTFHEALSGQAEIAPRVLLTYEDELYTPQALPPGLPIGWDATPEEIYGPWDTWTMAVLRGGRLPLWQSSNGLGSPLLVNGEATCFNPLKWVCFAANGVTSLSLSWYLALRLFFSGIGVLVLARSLGLQPLPAVLAATAYMLSGTALYRMYFMDTACTLLPWLVWAGARVARRGTLASAAVLALLVGAVVQVDHPEGALLSAAAAGVVASSLQASRRTLGLLGLAALLGAGLAAVEVLPFLAFDHASVSYLQDRLGFMMRLAMDGWTTGRDAASLLATLASPAATPEPFRFNLWVGAVTAVLCPLGLRVVPVNRVAGGLAGLFLGLFLLLPPSSPSAGLPAGVLQAIAHLPLFSAKSYYALPLLTLACGLLAAAGLQRLHTEVALGSLRRLAIGSMVLAGCALLLQSLAGTGLLLPYLANTNPHLDHAALVWVLVGLLAGAATTPRWRQTLTVPLLAALAAIDLVSAARIAHPPLPAFNYPAVPLVQHLQAQPGPFRVAGFGGALLPNTNMALGLDSLESTSAFHPARYYRYLQALSDTKRPVLSYALVSLPCQTRLLDLANVQYLLAPIGNPAGDAIAQALDRDKAHYTVDSQQGKVVVFKSKDVAPRAWVTYAAEFLPPGSPLDAVAERLRQSHQDWHAGVLLEARAPAGWQDHGDAVTPAKILARTPSEVTLEADAARPGYLVLSETYFPGWQVEVDGRAAEILPADLAFRAVFLPPGHHQVVYRYFPEGLALGAWVSLGALVTTLLLLLLG